jgi:hypothetical protein
MTRRGGFQELVSMPVKSEHDMAYVRTYYRNKYKGLEAQVQKFDELSVETMETGPREYLSNILVTYTEEEQVIADQVEKTQEEARRLCDDLHGRIRKRYYHLNFTDGYPILIETKSGQTRIERLPVSGSALIQHIGEGKEV